MIYEKNLFGQFRYHYKDDHGVRVDAADDLSYDISFIYFLYNIHQHHMLFSSQPNRTSSMLLRQYALVYQQEH